MKYYTVHQNNSGGYFIENEHVGAYLIVQANNAEEAEKKIMDITAPYSEYCACCGERWDCWFDEDDGTKEPMIYGERATEREKGFFSNYTVVYHADGTIERFGEKDA